MNGFWSGYRSVILKIGGQMSDLRKESMYSFHKNNQVSIICQESPSKVSDINESTCSSTLSLRQKFCCKNHLQNVCQGGKAWPPPAVRFGCRRCFKNWRSCGWGKGCCSRNGWSLVVEEFLGTRTSVEFCRRNCLFGRSKTNNPKIS